jgi:tetratricopeptide (TPR) repeat protein
VEQVFLGVPAGSSNYTPPLLRAVKTMRINKLAALFIIAIIVSPNLTIVRGQTLTILPFDTEYEPGDDVSISGTAAADANLTLIVVFNSTTLHEANFTAEGDGNYTEEYEIPEDAADGVYTVTVFDGGESAEADFAVSSDKILAETLIEQAEEAQDNVEDAFDELDVDIPEEANSSYLQGIDYLEMAEEDFDVGNYTEAAENAYEAIQLFGDAYERVQDLTPVEPDDDDDDNDDDGDDETGSPERLAVAIERAYVYWGRINETVTRLGDEGFNVTRVEEALAEAKVHLDMASMYQEEGNHTAAVRAFTAARTTMGRIHGFIESKVKERKEQQTEQFMEQFQRQIGQITDVLEGLQDSLEAGKTQRVRAVLEATARKLLRLSDRLGGEDIEDILDEIEDAVDELDDGVDELNGEGLSRQIKYANRFEAKMAKIESFNRTLSRYAEAGYETEELDEYFAEANGLLARIQAEVRAGNDEEAEELIDEAEELIEEVGRYFKEYQKEVKKAQRGEENSLRRHERSGDDDDDDDDDTDNN